MLSRGKVRDIYTVNDEQLLIVTSDRLSAFDVILPTPIPDGQGADAGCQLLVRQARTHRSGSVDRY